MASGRCHLTSHATLRRNLDLACRWLQLIELTLHPMGSELAFMQPACHGLNPCKPAIFRQAAEVGAYSFVLVHRIGGCYCICVGTPLKHSCRLRHAMSQRTAHKRHTLQLQASWSCTLRLLRTQHYIPTCVARLSTPFPSRLISHGGGPLRSARWPLLRI